MSVVLPGWQPVDSVAVLPKVFISYASENLLQAQHVADALLRRGYPVWLDRLCLLAGDRWDAEIEEGVATADAVVVLISTASVSKTGFLNSEMAQVLEAATLRQSRDTFIVPVRLDDTLPPRNLRRLQWVDWRNQHARADLEAPLRAMRRSEPHSADTFASAPPVKLRRLLVEGRTLDYVIELVETSGKDAVAVQLGASAFDSDGNEWFDRAQDRVVCLRKGVATYRRFLDHGVRDLLVGAVWWPRIPASVDDRGARCLARTEHSSSDDST